MIIPDPVSDPTSNNEKHWAQNMTRVLRIFAGNIGCTSSTYITNVVFNNFEV
jgi:hypothetical protein